MWLFTLLTGRPTSKFCRPWANLAFQNEPLSDLVVEVDITPTDIDKLSLYATLGVPELWRFNGREWRIYQLQESTYQEQEVSPTFPFVPKEKLYEFLTLARQDEIEAEQTLRAWVKRQRQGNP